MLNLPMYFYATLIGVFLRDFYRFFMNLLSMHFYATFIGFL